MFPLIFSILLTPILLVKYYELVKYKERMNFRNWLYLIFASLVVIAIYLEKIFNISL